MKTKQTNNKINGTLTFINDCNVVKIMKKLAQKKDTRKQCCYQLWPNFRTLKNFICL